MSPQRQTVPVTVQEALMQIGALAAEFISQPETWPVFFEWMASNKWPVESDASETMRNDVLILLAELPPSPNREEVQGMSHVCPAANRIGEPTVFCPTTGGCPICGGLLCPTHGCQMNPRHHRPEPEKEASHA